MGGLFFIPMVGLLGILIALYRRNPRRFLDGPAEDAPARLLRWAAADCATRTSSGGRVGSDAEKVSYRR